MAITKQIAVVAALAAAMVSSQAQAADIECGGYVAVAVGVSDGAAAARVAKFANFNLPGKYRGDLGPHYRVTFYDPNLNCKRKPKRRDRTKR